MELWSAPAGSGKTQWIINQLLAVGSQPGFDRVWVLLPTSRQAYAFRERMIAARAERPLPLFNIEMFNFYTLNDRLLSLARQPVRRLDNTARRSIVRAALRRAAQLNSLPELVSAAEDSSYITVYASLFDELKQGLIEPEDFERAAHTLGIKGDALALVYHAYQDLLLKHDLVDREGESWLALARLQAIDAIGRDVGLLAVDGFDQFSPVQANLIRALATRAKRTCVTLTQVADRETGVGRRFEQARDALGIPRGAVHAIPVEAEYRPAAAFFIEDGFRGKPTGTPLNEVQAAEVLTCIEAPNEAAEADAILREVKRLIVVDGLSPDQVMIAVRDWGAYRPVLATAAERFGIPLAFSYAMPLRDHPILSLLRNLLLLHESQFRARDLLTVLSSPYLAPEGLSQDTVALLRRIIIRHNVLRGDDAVWHAAIQAAARSQRGDFDQEAPALLSDEEAEQLEIDLISGLLHNLTPVEALGGDVQPIDRFVTWIEDLLGADPAVDPRSVSALDDTPPYSLNIIASVRDLPDNSSELAALHAIKAVLLGMLTADATLNRIGEGVPVLSWDSFRSEFFAALDSAELGDSPDRSGRVLVATASEARGLPHDTVVIVGLAEGKFPAKVSEDSLLLDSERERLMRAGLPLRGRAERAADDALFFELVAQARRHLILSRQTIEGAALWEASPFWHAILILLSPKARSTVTHIFKAGDTPEPDDAASPAEWILAVTRAHQHALRPLEWMQPDMQALVSHVNRVTEIEAHRLNPRLAHDGYSGQLTGAASSRYGRQHVWSVSQLEAYASSPYRFLAERLLRLEALALPESGLDPMTKGTLMHDALNSVYRQVAAHDLIITDDETARTAALAFVDSDEVLAHFEQAEDWYQFIADVTWESEKSILLDRLRMLVEADFSSENPVSGIAPGKRINLWREYGFGSAEDVQPELEIELPDGEMLRLRGRFDRVDIAFSGDSLHGSDSVRLVLIDYKTGSGEYSARDMAAGLKLQMPLYIRAAEIMIASGHVHTEINATYGTHFTPDQISVAGGVFWGTGRNRRLGSLSPAETYGSKASEPVEIIPSALQTITEYVQAIRAGDFRAAAHSPHDGKCATFCDFADLCRICATIGRRKPG